MDTLESPSRKAHSSPSRCPQIEMGLLSREEGNSQVFAKNLCPHQGLVPAQFCYLYLKDWQAGLSFFKGLFPFLLRLIGWPPPSP